MTVKKGGMMKTHHVIPKLPRPKIFFDQIGGQKKALERLQKEIEGWLCGYKSTPGRYLFYGPPGCGKTMTAIALANELERKLGEEVALFRVYCTEFSIRPEFIRETIRKIRESFTVAIEKANRGFFVVLLFEDLDVLFPNMESFVVSAATAEIAGMYEELVLTTLSMIDKLEKFPKVLVIGTTKQPDSINPALLRPGRFASVIEFPRPKRKGTEEIFRIYLRPLADLLFPYSQTYLRLCRPLRDYKLEAVEYFVKVGVEAIFGDKEPVATIKFLDTGKTKPIYKKDFVSGAMIADIVGRMRLNAIFADIKYREKGLRPFHLTEAIDEVFDRMKRYHDPMSLMSLPRSIITATPLYKPPPYRSFTIKNFK